MYEYLLKNGTQLFFSLPLKMFKSLDFYKLANPIRLNTRINDTFA